jgi:hyperosmotically inducible protein
MKSRPSSWGLALVCLIGLAACNRPATELTPVSIAGKMPHGAVHGDMSAEDALITSHVKMALVAAEGINGEDIVVTTRQGEVTLTGSLPARQISRAEQVARNVEGVRDVYNKLKPLGVMA